MRLSGVCAIVLGLSLVSLRAAAEEGRDAGPTCGTGGVCGLDDVSPSSTLTQSSPQASSRTTPVPDAGAPAGEAALLFFWGVGCPHCEEAKPFVEALRKEEPRLRIESIEVRSDADGRHRFVALMKEVGATAVGVPTFVVGRAYVVGYTKDETEPQVRGLVSAALHPGDTDAGPTAEGSTPKSVKVPWIGDVDPISVSLPWLTLGVGLADGLNPCAIWVLVVLLGILLHVETTRRMLLYAGTFVVMSGVVYFAFMVAWATFFELMGFSRVVTRILGAALLGMGLINLKDMAWFKKGPSLVISDKVKPGLFRRMRAIASAASTPAALAGIVMLAFVVNLVELGCTLGLPAIYTRILSLRGLTAGPRLAYLALYNVAYVVPLLIVVAVFIGMKRRLTMTEGAARVLKGVSGGLLTLFGILFLVAPHLLAGM